jgi:ABC-type Mn2+/Zn2+ transport system ATPase subunit
VPTIRSEVLDGVLVDLRDVDAGYGEDPAVRSINLTVEQDTFTGVVGPSGSGKTTLLRLLSGALRPTSGRLRRASGLTVGYVPQLETVNWDFPITVGECVLMASNPTRPWPWPTRAERDAVRRVLERLGIAELADRRIKDISGGQQQRMFLARALLQRPQLLLLDEPTSGLDVATRHDILHLLADLNRDGIAVVLTTHDLNGMAAHLPHLICLREEVIAAGSAAEVITPAVLERTFGARMDVLEHLGLLIVVDRSVQTDSTAEGVRR